MYDEQGSVYKEEVVILLLRDGGNGEFMHLRTYMYERVKVNIQNHKKKDVHKQP